jgi:hypothetical protein
MTAPTTIEAPNVARHEMPNGAVVYYRDADHSYWERYDNGQVSGRVPGISTIAKAGNGDTGSVDGLMGWAIKLYKQGIDFKAKREEAAAAGTAVHKVLESLATNNAVIYEDAPGHVEAVIDWWHTRHPEPRAAEFFVYDPERKFAGQPDLFYGSTLLDLKTGSIRPEAFVQLNLYRLAMRNCGYVNYLGENTPSRLLLLDTRDDGTWREVEVPIRPEWALDAIRVYENGKAIGKALRAATK